MRRDDIKIIEFDQDDDRFTAARSGETKGVKIVEYDDDPHPERKVVATARDIGQIKIVEFDDDPPPVRSAPPETPRVVVKPIKIKDFGEERGAGQQSRTGSKIKIMEFD